MDNWRRSIPLLVLGALRSAIRAAMGLALLFLSLFVAWASFEFLTHLKGFLSRTIFGHDW